MEYPQYPAKDPNVVMPPYVPPPYVTQPPPAAVVMTTQTTPAAIPPPAYRDYLACSIITMLCCCLPLGIVALIFSIKTRSDLDHRDHVLAEVHSRSAFAWNRAALGAGICLQIGWISYVIYYYVTYSRYAYYG